MKTYAGYNDADIGSTATKGAFLATVTAGVQSDTLDLTRVASAFLLNAAGDIKFLSYDDKPGGGSPNGVHPATMTCLAGVIYPVRLRRIFDAGTTVTDAQIVLFYDT